MLHTKLLESLILIIFYIYTILNILEAEDLFNWLQLSTVERKRAPETKHS